ncbi:HAMP domain-containing protein [Aquabacterium soli]|uniref:HAMP domain-containing protein n=2 Tax=Aquabacterium soli TaxID=2493092 RepID=A0A426V893_9BURK|nr:HAMP domain-containing protein [Aquabacterium soli]
MGTPGGPGPDTDDDITRVIGPPRVAPAMPDDDPEKTVVKAPTVPRPATRTVPVPPPAPLRPFKPKTGTALALPPGFRLHEYRIDRVLGQGGFGITYLATDVNLNTKVAIKEYLPEDIAFRTSGQTVSAHSSRYRDRYRSGLDSFLVEGRTLATFRHPNIVRVARFFEAHQTAYMVLEYERGSPFKTWWPEHAHIGEKELLTLIQPLLDGLSVVHGMGFLHRDIKPDNIQVRRRDGSLVLLDFGSARQAVSHGTQDDVAVTPGYAPIEQYEDGDQGAWTDIYAMGATLYWTVTGQKPPDAMDRAMAAGRPGGTDPWVPATVAAQGRYSESFLKAIDWALALQAAERPQDIAQWRGALFATHAASLGLQEALRAGDAADPADPADHLPHHRLALRSAPRRLAFGLWRTARRVVRPGSWPMAIKMSLAMVMAALLPMLITGYYNLQGSLAAVSDGELRNLQQLARSTAGRVSQLIGDSQNLARTLGTDEAFVQFLAHPDANGAEAMRSKLERLVKSNPDIGLMMLMDTKGTAIVSSDPKVTGRNFAFREYFREAMQGHAHVTGIVVGAATGAAGMFYAHPVFGEDYEVVGAVVLRIRAASFDGILEQVGSGSQLTPFMVDGDGVVIYHPNQRVLYSSLVRLPEATLAKIRADQRFKRDSIESLDMPDLAQAVVQAKEQGHVTYRSTISRTEEIAGFSPVVGQDWVVGVAEPRSAFEEPLNRLFAQLLWSVLLVGLLFTGLALMFARSIVRPIRALTGAADALKRGDYAAANLQVRTRDEIGQLARTFNVLIDVLRQRERERDRDRSSS